MEDFVIATGRSESLRHFCEVAFDAVGLRAADHVRCTEQFCRPSDVKFGLGNPSKAAKKLKWSADKTMTEIVHSIVAAELEY